MYLFVYCLTWLHVCTDSGLSFIVSLLLLSAVQCSHSLIIIYRLHLPSLCRCSLDLLSQPNLLTKLLLVLSELSVIVLLFVMFDVPCSHPPARLLCLPSLHHCTLELLLQPNLLLQFLLVLSGLSVIMSPFLSYSGQCSHPPSHVLRLPSFPYFSLELLSQSNQLDLDRDISVSFVVCSCFRNT